MAEEKNEQMEDLDDKLKEIRKQTGDADKSDEFQDDDDDDLDSDDDKEDKDADTDDKEDDSKESDKEDEEEESEDDDESDEEDDESDESEDEDDEDDEEEKKPITQQFNRLRSQKRESDHKVKELTDLVTSLTEKVKSYESSGVLPQEFVDAAKEMGISDPKNLQKLSELILSQADKKYKSIADRAQATEEAIAPILSQQKVDKEWDDFIPTVEESYSGANRQQIKEAHKLMSKLAQSKSYVDKDMDFILWKEKESFEEIFGSPKKKSMMSSKRQPSNLVKEDEGVLPTIERGNHESIMKAKKKMRNLAARDQFFEDKDGSDSYI